MASSKMCAEKNSHGFERLLPVWNCIASFGTVAESLCNAQACHTLRRACQDTALWRQHAMSLRYIRPAENCHESLHTAAPQARSLLLLVDWRQLVKLNMASRRGVSVRLRGSDMRLPLKSGDSIPMLQALCRILAQILRRLHSPGSWPFRLRWLQWGGRPGCLVDHGNVGHLGPGSRLFLEWGDPILGWPLPPVVFDACLHFDLHWGRQASWTWPKFQQLSMGQGYMVHVVSSLLPKTEQWLQVPAESNMLDLLEVIGHLLRQNATSALTHRPLHFRLVDMCPLKGKEVAHPALKDLAWAQCETLYVEAAKLDACPLEGCSVSQDEISIVDLKRAPAFSSLRKDSVCDIQETASVATLVFGTSGLGSATEQTVRLSHPVVNLDDEVVDLQRQTSESVRELCCQPSPEVRDAAGPDSLDSVRPGESQDEVTLPVRTRVKERIVPHYSPVLLPGTSKCRQFEFHPLKPDIMLVGDKDGRVKIVNTGTHERRARPATQVDNCALLGLSWLRHAPNIAVCGGSTSGSIQFLRYIPDARPGSPALARAATVQEKFIPKLSSLSVNCSDNFLLASGISSSIRIFDIETGKVTSRGSDVHEHFINISRFCNTSPHIFATASFDHTCKIWDLRRPLKRQNPLKTLRTGGHNVMGTFSPDDRLFLCSGLDTRLWQFEVGTWTQTSPIALRSPLHKERYRRAAYLANSKYFVTGSTEESHIHLFSVHGKKIGCVDLRGMLQVRASPLRSYTEPIRGTVCLEDADPQSGSSRLGHEYVQSLRTHPVIENRVGVLMAMPQAVESHIVLLDLDCQEVEA
mmetsp:Transcript_121466/g.288666  ORF Transcript_121466/g.288666 Transcript_121466/m.288666 type:complete len:806 (+) Transcript_121466:57-2474(+)